MSTAAQGLTQGGDAAARSPPLARAVVALRVLRHALVALNLLLIKREESRGFAFSRLKLAVAPAPDLDLATLGWIIDCPEEEIEFTRVGPSELAHGGNWAQRHHLDSYRWPLLDQPVIHGQVVRIRMGVPFPKDPAGLDPLPMRALTEWEGRNALRWLSHQALPLLRSSQPIHESFLRSIGWPLRAEFEAAGPARQAQIIKEEQARRKAAAEAHAPILAAQLAADLIGHPIGSRF